MATPRGKEVIRGTLQELLIGIGPEDQVYRYADNDANVELVAEKHFEGRLETLDVYQLIEGVADKLALSPFWVATWSAFNQQCPDFGPVAANVNILVTAYQKRYPGWPLEIEHLYEMVGEQPELVAQLTRSTSYFEREARGIQERNEQDRLQQEATANAEKRSRMVLELTRNLADDPGRQDRKSAELMALSSADLQAHYEQAIRAQELRKMSSEDLRKVVKAENPSPYDSQFVPIPAQWRVPGKDVFIDWSQTLLQRLDSRTIGTLLKLYGEKQLNAACRKGSQQQ